MYINCGPIQRLYKIFTGSILGILTGMLILLFIIGFFLQTDYGSKITTSFSSSTPSTVPVSVLSDQAENSPNATAEIPGRVGPTGGELKVLKTLTISENGAVIENVDVAGEIRVRADNVTIRNFRANNVFKEPNFGGLLLEDGEIHGEQDPTAHGVVFSDFTARRLNIHGVEDAFKANGDALIENCWIHDLAFIDKGDDVSHNDGVQVSAGSNVIVRNSLFENIKGTAAVFIKPDQGQISNITVENNILGGGAYTLYVVGTPQHGYPSNVSIINNTFLNENLYGYRNIEQSSTVFRGNKTIDGKSL